MMRLFKLRYLITLPAAVIILAFVLFPLIIHSAPLLGLRQQIATKILTNLLGRKVQVLGDVELDIGATTSVRIDGTDIGYLVKHETVSREHVDRMKFSFRLLESLTQGFEVSSFSLEGFHKEVDWSGEPKAVPGVSPDGLDSIEKLASVPVRFLSHLAAGNMVVRNLTFSFRDHDTGWNKEIVIKEAKSIRSENGKRILITGSGAINQVPMSMTGSFPNPRSGDASTRGPFEIGVEVAGAKSLIAGNIDLSNKIAVIDAELDDSASVVSVLFKMFGIAADFDAQSTTKAKLTGPLNKIVANEIDFRLNIKDGYKVSIKGRISNLVELQGINLEIKGIAPEKSSTKPGDETLLDISLTSFKSLIVGDINAINLDRFIIFSNFASAELGHIGPISVDRVARGKNGELRIEGIHVLNGPPEQRTLDLKGHVLDLLNLNGMLLEGTFDMPAAAALSLKGASAEAELGRMAGNISVRGVHGDFSIDKLQAQVTGSDILKLTVKLADGGNSELNEVTVDTDLKISDLTAFAAALDQKVGKVGSASFSGKISISKMASSLLGTLIVDVTRADVAFRMSLEEGVPKLDGSIKSKKLLLDDLAGFASLFKIVSNQDIHQIDISDDFVHAIRAKIDVDIAHIAGGRGIGKSAGHIRATANYQNGVILVDPLKMRFLNGVITSRIHTDTRKTPLSHTIQGNVSKLSLGSLLRQMQLPQLVSGSLNLNFKLALAGNTSSQALNSASGDVSGSIWGGVLETGLLNLSGLNLVSLLMTKPKAAGRTEFVCVVFPLQFKNGRGSTRSFVLETKFVQAVGVGSLDIRKDRIDMRFQPRPKVKEVVEIVSPFTVTGPLNAPHIKLDKGGVARRVVGGTLALPLNLIGSIFTRNRQKEADHKPCILKKKNQPKRRK